jgi:septal ring factor EnvC (AmiA/AmiB activator)
MGRYSYDDSRIPQTCPLINEIIDAVKSVDWKKDDWHDEKGLLDIIEQIRKHNGDLRDWGSDKNQEIHDLNEELNDLRNEVRHLTEQLVEVNHEVKELNEMIDNLTQK